MRNIKVAAVQMSMTNDVHKNIEKAEKFVRLAAADGANIILLPELFENLYFCQERNYDYYKLAAAQIILLSAFTKSTSIPSTILSLLSMLTEKFSVSIENLIFPTIIFIRKNSTLRPVIQALRFGIQNSVRSVSAFAGISGFPKQQGVWH